jgi:hypothetical protein
VSHRPVESAVQLPSNYLFIASQLVLLGLVFIFMKLDWTDLLSEHGFRFRRQQKGAGNWRT